MTSSACPGTSGWTAGPFPLPDSGGSPPCPLSSPSHTTSGRGAMKHDWRTNRRLQPHPDGQLRWDRAYQLVLGWAAAGDEPRRSHALGPAAALAQETIDEDRDLCARLDPAPGADPDHRPADRAVEGSHRVAGLPAARGERLP